MAIFLFLKAIAYWLDRYDLVIQSSDLAGGFTGLQYTDVNAKLPALTILTFVALLVAAACGGPAAASASAAASTDSTASTSRCIVSSTSARI